MGHWPSHDASEARRPTDPHAVMESSDLIPSFLKAITLRHFSDALLDTYLGAEQAAALGSVLWVLPRSA
jgi:hypothetical protein